MNEFTKKDFKRLINKFDLTKQALFNLKVGQDNNIIEFPIKNKGLDDYDIYLQDVFKSHYLSYQTYLGTPDKLKLIVKIDNEVYKRAKKKKNLGMLINTDLNNYLYRFYNIIITDYPTLTKEHRAKNGLKQIEIVFNNTDYNEFKKVNNL
ncbi:MAG: hypothetical protein GTN36_05410 [Candidatus Aenigmarchaeota archaeon]|nr:hypothetical protein [Candidatus Aenigmarchaeota archaeon]